MLIMPYIRIFVIAIATILFLIFSRKLSRTSPAGHLLLIAGILLVALNQFVGALFHSNVMPENLQQHLFPTIGRITGHYGQTIGIVCLLAGTYSLVRSLRQHFGAHYSALVENSLVGVYLIQDGVFKFVNPRLAELFGYAREELIGMPISNVIAPKDRNLVAENIRKRLDKEIHSIHYEFTGLKKNGEERQIEVFGSRSIYDGAAAIHGTLMDITERKHAERAIRASEERFRALANSSYDIIGEINTEGKHIYVSDNIEDIIGYTPEEIVNTNILMYVHPDDYMSVFSEFEKSFNNNTSGRVVFRCRDKSGEWHWFECTGHPYVTRIGEKRGILVSRDITLRKKIEEEFAKASKLESIGVLAGGIAHDFNNILTVILGNVSLAKSLDSKNDELQQMLSDAEKACLKAKDLTQQFLTFAKGGDPIKKLTDMDKVLRDNIDFALRGSKVKSNLEIKGDLWPVHIDAGQICQVINNLMMNADQAMPEGGTIEVLGENVTIKDDHSLPLDEGNYVRIKFTDHGVGIREDHLSKIFDPYFSTKQKGSGLGLTISYSVVKNHGGLLTAESQLGKGTCFDLYLPAVLSGKLDRTSTKEEDAMQTSLHQNGKILVMDDEAAIRTSLQRMLTRIGYEVVLSENGAEAVNLYKDAKISGSPFDAVLMDLTIPGGIGGKEAIKDLIQFDPDVKAIVTSGYSNDPIMSDYKKYGFKGVIAKPYQFHNLSKTLQEVILNNH